MSTQPLTPSNSTHFDYSKWREISSLAALLLIQPDLESLIIKIIHTCERIFPCKGTLWLSSPYSAKARLEILKSHNIYSDELNKLTQLAYEERRVIPIYKQTDSQAESFESVAMPLIADGQVLGVIELDRIDQAGFTQQEIDLIHNLASQSSIGLDWYLKKMLVVEQQGIINLINDTALLNKAIISILDINHLINSAISSIHQRYGFSKVNLFMIRDRQKLSLLSNSISRQGLEPSSLCRFETDNHPVIWAIKNRELVIVDDTSLESRFPPSSFDDQTKSEFVVPLISGVMLLGALDLCSADVNTFRPRTISIMQSLADNIAVAVRNAILYHNEQVKRQVAERIQAVIGELSVDLSLDAALENMLIELEKLLPCEACALWLNESTSRDNEPGSIMPAMKIACVRIADSGKMAEEANIPINTSEIKVLLSQYDDNFSTLLSEFPWMIEIINSREPRIDHAALSFEPLGEFLAYREGYTAIGIPLSCNGSLLGIIIAISRQADIFSTDDAQLIATAFAENASVGIKNLRLYTAAHEQDWISTVLLQVAEMAQSAASMVDLLEGIARMIPDLAGANGCTIYLWDQSAQILYPQVSYGYDEVQHTRLKAWEISARSSALVEQLAHSQTPVILNPENLPGDAVELIFPEYDLRIDLLILFPMLVGSNLQGAILVDFADSGFGKNSSQKVWDEKYTLLQGVADLVAVASDNLQRMRSGEEEAYISIALLQVAQAIVSLNRLDEVLASIVRITPILVGVKRCIIYLWDPTIKVIQPSQQYGFSRIDLEVIGHQIRLSEFPFVEAIIDRNLIAYHQLEPDNTPAQWNEVSVEDIHVLEGTSDDPDESSKLKLDDDILRENARLLIGFPLAVKSEVLGVMVIEEEDPAKGVPFHHIREKRIEIVNGITQQAALAIKNEFLQREAVKSERMERELQLAREIQATFLPDHLPELAGWEMDARWQPAREVGGDFYDILFLDDKHIGFVIADVADKGMPAALFMTLIRTLIRAAAKDNPSPASVIRQVNELLIPDSKHGMFVTVFYAVIDVDAGSVVYTNAGHNPPVVLNSQSDKFVELTRTCIALGLFGDIEVVEREIKLNPGDWILFYTDGVTEAFSPDEEMFGTKRLFEILQHQKQASPKEILDGIEGSVHEFIDGLDLLDDVTLAVIRRKN